MARGENTLRKGFTKSEPDGWRYLPWITRELILSVVLGAWTSLKDDAASYDGVIKLHQEFFKYVASQWGRVSSYSLNYDPIIVEALDGLSYRRGFLPNGTFSDQDLTFAAESVLAQLHGGVGFVPSRNTTRWEGDYENAQRARVREIVHSGHSGGLGMKGQHASSYVVTSPDKLDPLAGEVFSVYYQRFAADMLASELVVLIGIGFGDDHLNAFLTHLPLAHPGQTLLVVDLRSADEVRSLLTAPKGFDFLARLARIPGHHFAAHPGQQLGELAANIPKPGYGRFSQHIDLYAMGTKAFLEDSPAWDALLVPSR